MAIIDAFKENSILALQLKQNLSPEIKSNLNSLKGIPGYFGTITSDVSGALSQLNNNVNSGLEVSATLSESLNKNGFTESIKNSFLSNTAFLSVVNKTDFANVVPKNPFNLDDRSTRLPSSYRETPKELIDRAKNRTISGSEDGINNLSFPTDINKSNDVSYTFLMLTFENYSRKQSFASGNLQKSFTLYLPIPDNYNHAHNIKYNEKELGLLGEAEKQIGNFSDQKDFVNKFDQNLQNLTSEDSISTAATLLQKTSKIASSISPDSDIGALASASLLGSIPNPHPSLFFDGLSLRTFDWNWKLVPRTPDEAEIIQKIIYNIKIRILPSVSGNTRLKYPDLITPSVMKGGKKSIDMGFFKKCHCTGININYTGEGTSSFFRNGKPVSINLNLQLQEVQQYLSEDERNQNNKNRYIGE